MTDSKLDLSALEDSSRSARAEMATWPEWERQAVQAVSLDAASAESRSVLGRELTRKYATVEIVHERGEDSVPTGFVLVRVTADGETTERRVFGHVELLVDEDFSKGWPWEAEVSRG